VQGERSLALTVLEGNPTTLTFDCRHRALRQITLVRVECASLTLRFAACCRSAGTPMPRAVPMRLNVENCPGLVELRIGGAAFVALHIRSAPRLRLLEASSIGLRELRLEGAPALETVLVSNNPMEAHHVWIAPASMSRVEALDLSCNALTELPECVRHARALRTLNVAHNMLRAWPESISSLHTLRVLNIRVNGLTALGGSIAGLRQLDMLDASRNRLTGLPPGIERLPLRVLNLAFNPLDDVPEALVDPSTSAFAHLRSLGLRGTRLTWIGEGLGARTLLVELDLALNPFLGNLPRDLVSLRFLRFVDISGTALNSLPAWMSWTYQVTPDSMPPAPLAN
jgi:hypothetical protein